MAAALLPAVDQLQIAPAQPGFEDPLLFALAGGRFSSSHERYCAEGIATALEGGDSKYFCWGNHLSANAATMASAGKI